MFIPLTGLTTVIGGVVMLGAWLFVGQRISQTHTVALRPVRLLHSYFLYMAIFFGLMSLPYFWLITSPQDFPLTMAWGYVVGHIFLYIGSLQVARMTCAIVPRLNKVERLVKWIWPVVAVVVTVVNAITMIWGVRPGYDYDHNVVLYNAHPFVGASIGLLAAISFFPAAILFIISAVKSQGPRRIRSMLLGGGFILMMTAGPLHDVARTGSVYAIADVLTMLSIVIVGAGVAYRLEQSLSLSAPPVVAPSSNTV